MHTSSRITNILLIVMIAVGIGIMAMLASGARGGPLDPTGSPGSTFGVREAGTPIESVPTTISTSGKYYFVKDLTFPGGAGTAITISANDVWIDLNGFTLRTGGFTGQGIASTSYRLNTQIENGTISGFLNSINLSSGAEAHLSDIRVQGFGPGGTGISVGSNSLLEGCVVTAVNNDALVGVEVGNDSTIRECEILTMDGDGVRLHNGAVLKDSSVLANGRDGASFGVRVMGTETTILGNVMWNFGRDIGVASTAGLIIDNVIQCPDAIVTLAGGGNFYAPTDGAEHSNQPRYAAGFC